MSRAGVFSSVILGNVIAAALTHSITVPIGMAAGAGLALSLHWVWNKP